jgi:hypothetical protein
MTEKPPENTRQITGFTVAILIAKKKILSVNVLQIKSWDGHLLVATVQNILAKNIKKSVRIRLLW